MLIAYDGTEFHGWSRQPAVRTVQGSIEAALAPLMGGSEPRLSVAGRTDAGVHAVGQVVSFEAPSGLSPSTVQRALNGRLAPEVVVRSARRAPDGFDARRSAIARQYLYRVDTGPLPDPLTARFVWHRPGRLARAPMRRAARFLLGEHDFASFCRRQDPPAGTVRRLERVGISAAGDQVRFTLRANAFCHQMVRSVVGMLVRAGEGRLDPERVPGILEARDRGAASLVAPPHGLVLMLVAYPGARRS